MSPQKIVPPVTDTIFELKCDPLYIFVIVQIGAYNSAAAKKFAKRKGYDDDVYLDMPNYAPAGASGCCWGSPNVACSFIWLEEMPTDRYTESLLVHEIVHAVSHGMREMGSQCEELKSYLIGNFYKESMSLIDKELKPKKAGK